MRNRLALLAALLGLGSVVGAVGLITGDRSITVGPNVFINPEGFIDANNSPSVAMNPRDPRSLVVSHRIDRPGFSASMHWSVDAGTSWIQTRLPLPDGVERCGAPAKPDEPCPFGPDLAFAPDGTLYVLYVHLTGNGNTPENLWLARSTDGGKTLSAPVEVAGELTLQGRLAIDRMGTIHLTWLQGGSTGVLSLTSRAPIMYARSTDDGRTFSQPVEISDGDREYVGVATPVVDSRGNLFVLYQDFEGDFRDFLNEPGPPWEEPFSLVLARSTDGGRTFSPGVEIESDIVAAKRFLVYLPEFPSIAAGPDGSLYVAWADGRNGDEDVFLRRSADGGVTWTAPLRVNDNPVKDGTGQYLPKVAVAPNGRVDVAFLDRRDDPSNTKIVTTLATSSDEARTFRNLRVSSKSFDAGVGPEVGPEWLEPDFGTRLGLASWETGTFAAWTDSRLGTEATQRQDVVGARVDFPDLSGIARNRVLVIGMLIAAGIALVLWGMQGPGVRATTARRGSSAPG